MNPQIHRQVLDCAAPLARRGDDIFTLHLHFDQPPIGNPKS